MSEAPSAGEAWTTHPWVAAGRDRVRFGIFGGPWTDWPALRDFVQLAEAVGIDACWMADHPLHFPECWIQLAALAATTRTIRLGSLVNCIFYRTPALLARQAADVDRISGGRLLLGLGMGDNVREFEEMGLPLPPVRQRQQALEETIAIVRGLWGETPFTYEGQHVQVRAAQVQPGPVQRPRVPILIAGGGEQVTLRQVAHYADASNFGPHAHVGSAFTHDDVRGKYAALRRHCEARGRPYDSVLRTGWTGPVVCAETPGAVQLKVDRLPQWLTTNWAASLAAGTPRDLIAHYQSLVDAGMQYFTAVVWNYDGETARLLAERVAPELAFHRAVPGHQ